MTIAWYRAGEELRSGEFVYESEEGFIKKITSDRYDGKELLGVVMKPAPWQALGYYALGDRTAVSLSQARIHPLLDGEEIIKERYRLPRFLSVNNLFDLTTEKDEEFELIRKLYFESGAAGDWFEKQKILSHDEDAIIERLSK